MLRRYVVPSPIPHSGYRDAGLLESGGHSPSIPCLPPFASRSCPSSGRRWWRQFFGGRMGPPQETLVSPGKRARLCTQRDAHRLPGCRVVLEEGVGELHGDTLPVVGVLVLRDSEEHGGRVGGCRGRAAASAPGAAQHRSVRSRRPAGAVPGGREPPAQGPAWQRSPVPSFLECRSSIRGAEAPSASMASAASLSWASSHRTPAATRWMFSTGE